MNIDELATNVARDIGAVRQKSCKRVDGVEYHFEQSELEQFAKELITEYEKAAGGEPFWYAVVSDKAPVVNKAIRRLDVAEEYAAKSSDAYPGVHVVPLYPRPDPRVAELEAENIRLRSAAKTFSAKYAEDQEHIAALLVAIEAKDVALEKIACIGNGDTHGNSIGNCMAIDAIALSPSAELLEARDRKRDTKLLRIIEQRIHPQDSYQDDYFKAKVHSYNIVNELIKQRESGEWKPELGD